MTDLEKLLNLRAAVIRFLKIDTDIQANRTERYEARDRLAELTDFRYPWKEKP